MKLFAYSVMAAALFVASPALAEDLHFKIQNDTDTEITEVHVSRVSTNSWEENILDGDVDAGQALNVTIADGLTTCKYDLQVVFADGAKNEWRNQDLCKFEGGTYRIHEDSTAASTTDDLHFKIQNDTDTAITEVHVSRVSTNSWEENILDNDVDAGESLNVTIADGLTTCKYDLQVVFEDGAKNEWRNQDMCKFEGGTYRIHM